MEWHVLLQKMKLFQTKNRFLGHEIYQGKTKLIQRSIEFANKFFDEIKKQKQLQRFIGCLNYVFFYYSKYLRIIFEYIKDLGKMHLHGLRIILI